MDFMEIFLLFNWYRLLWLIIIADFILLLINDIFMRSLILVLVTIYVFDFEDRKKIDPSLQIIFRKI